jgi:T-complex protein 1 subunit alpha
MEGEETFESSLLGYADEVAEERIADDDVIMIKGTKTTSAVCDSTYLGLLNFSS